MMGNGPLQHSRRERFRLCSCSPPSSGLTNRLRLKSYPSMDLSVEDLQPYYPPPIHRYSRPTSCNSRWLKSEDRDFEDSIILGMEVDPELEDVCSGLLKFHYSDGLDTFTENLSVQSKSTVSDLLPDLITTFLPHEYQMAAIDGTQPSSVSLIQGKMERDLDLTEKPLDIVLDCSSRGLASPKFLFKCSLPTMGIPLTPHRTSRGGRPGGLDLSGEFGRNLSQPDHHTSMTSVTSLGSGISISSSRSGKSKSTSSLTPKQKKKKSLPQQFRNGAPSPSATPASLARLQLSIPNDSSSPSSSSKTGRSKTAAMSHFFSRSLRGKKKSKAVAPGNDLLRNSVVQDSNDEREDDEELEDYDDEDDEPISFAADDSTSPHGNLDRKFSLSTVMHIYFVEGKHAQVYKSVLVSEKASTKELIEQALERYDMKNSDPSNFALFDVIGKWQDVPGMLKTDLRYPGKRRTSNTSGGRRRGVASTTTTLPNLNILNASPLVQRRATVEEFVVCYSRELDMDENPYKMQYYLAAQEGFTRRFELRSKLGKKQGRVRPHFHEKSHSVDIMERPDEATPTPDILNSREDNEEEAELERGGIFGDTIHRKRAKRNRILQHPSSIDSADPDTAINILDPAEDDIDHAQADNGQGLRKIFSSKSGMRGSHSNQAGSGREDSEIPIAMNANFAPNFSKLGCSSPDSGVEIQKGPRQSTSNKSSISSEQSENAAAATSGETHPLPAFYPGNLDSAFLLSLRLFNPYRESLVHSLSEDLTEVLSVSPEASGCLTSAANGKVHLISNEGEKQRKTLCSISKQLVTNKQLEETLVLADSSSYQYHYEYRLLPGQSRLSILHNGIPVTDSVTLRHGDLIAVGESYLFMFQDYSTSLTPRDASYSWRPQLCSPHRASSPEETKDKERRKSSSSRETLVEATDRATRDVKHSSGMGEELNSGGKRLQVQTTHQGASTQRTNSPTMEHLNYKVNTLQEPQQLTITSSSSVGLVAETTSLVRDSASLQTPTTATVTRVPVTGLSDEESAVMSKAPPSSSQDVKSRKKRDPHSPRNSCKTRVEKLRSHKALGKAKSLPLPKDRKLVFSFKTSEEDKLLRYVVSESVDGAAASVRRSPCKLAPAYLLAMCTEYCNMTSGPSAVARFIQKTTDRIQEVVWECTNMLSTWQPTMESLQNPLLQKKELFPLLEPVFYWLANTLEFYNFLELQKASLHLDNTSTPSHKAKKDSRESSQQREKEDEEEKPMEILYSILVYIYQQAFYPISKVLYQSLPVMLESCVDQEGAGSRADSAHNLIVIDQAVEFLQALLDMMTEQNIHLEVVSQFFANIFFFVNAAMFNSLMDQGSELGLFQHCSGCILRSNLDLLEGWACQVGFKDAVLRYLARFSGAIDLLATPTEQLLQLNWGEICSEFPVLHPSQLHYLLSQYLLPVSCPGLPRHWTPSQQDAPLALSKECLMESFDGHPGFNLPSCNYTLDLNHPPTESDDFQEALESLHASLHKNGHTSTLTPSSLTNTISIDRTSPTPPAQPSSRKIKRRGTEPGSDSSSSFQKTLCGNIGSSTESQEDLLTVSWRTMENSQQLRQPYSKSPNVGSSSPGQKRKFRGKSKQNPATSNIVENSSRTRKVEATKTISGSPLHSSSREEGPPEGHSISARVHPTSHRNEVPQPLSWSENNLPHGARVVTIPRGDKGFGVILAQKMVGGVSSLLVQQLLPGSTACSVEGLAVGDQVIAMEGQPVGGADYLIAQQYLKDAEEELSITLAPRTGRVSQ